MDPKDITDRLSNSDVATLLAETLPKLNGRHSFWDQITPVLTLLPGDIRNHRGFQRTDYSRAYRIVTRRHDYPAPGIPGEERTNYWVEIYDESVERDSMGVPIGGKDLFAVKETKSFEEAMLLHFSALRHFKDRGY